MSDSRRTGVVVTFGEKRYGFIRDSETRQDYFFHISDVKGEITPHAGDMVEFQVLPYHDPKRPRAVGVVITKAVF